MSDFKLGPVPQGIQAGLATFLLEVKKRIDVLGGVTNSQLMTRQDLIDIGLITTAGLKADDTSDRTIFVLTPTTPYKVGDLWVKTEALYRCQVGRLTGVYNSNDWVPYAEINTINSGDGLAALDSSASSKLDTIEENAQVNPANLSALDALAAYDLSVVNAWRKSGGTLIDADYIATNSIYLNRLVGLNAGTVTFSGSSSMTFVDGADLILQSTSDTTSMIQFTRSGYTYDIRSLSSGTYLYIAGRTAGSGIQIGDGSYTRYINIRPTYSGDLISGSLSGTHYGFEADNSGGAAYVLAYTGSNNGIHYTYTQDYFRANPNGTATAPALGHASYPWGAAYFAGGVISGNIQVGTTDTYSLGGGTGNRFSVIYAQTSAFVYHNSAYGLYGGAAYDSTIRVKIKGGTSDDTAYLIAGYDSGNNGVFGVNNDGDVSGNYFLPLVNNSGAVGTGSWYFNYGKFYSLYYVNGYDIDIVDDLEELHKHKQLSSFQKDKHGQMQIDILDQPRFVTNFNELPDELKEEYKIEITHEEIDAVIAGAVKTKEIIGGKKNPYTGETLTEVTVDKEFIAQRLGNNIGKHLGWAMGAIYQLDNEYSEIIDDIYLQLIDINKKLEILGA